MRDSEKSKLLDVTLAKSNLGQDPLDEEPRPSIIEAFQQNHTILRNYISRFLVSSHDIDDVSQETFLRAYNAAQKKTISEPRAFLFRIAKNLMLSEFNKKSYKLTDYVDDLDISVPANESINLENDVIAQQKLGIYCEALASLPPKRRRVMLMKKIYGMSHKEIARRMDITVSAVDKHLLKGAKHCQSVMGMRYPELTDKQMAEKDKLGKECC